MTGAFGTAAVDTLDGRAAELRVYSAVLACGAMVEVMTGVPPIVDLVLTHATLCRSDAVRFHKILRKMPAAWRDAAALVGEDPNALGSGAAYAEGRRGARHVVNDWERVATRAGPSVYPFLHAVTIGFHALLDATTIALFPPRVRTAAYIARQAAREAADGAVLLGVAPLAWLATWADALDRAHARLTERP